MSDFDVNLNDLIRSAFTAHQEMRFDDAIIHYNQIIEINSNIPTVYSNLGAIYLQQDNNIKAREYFEKAVEIEPNNASNLYNLAVILTSKFQEHKLAFRHAVKALNLDNNNIKLYQLLGNLHQDLGKTGAQKFFAIAESMASAQTQSQVQEDTFGEIDDNKNNNLRWIGEEWASSSDLLSMVAGEVLERNIEDVDDSNNGKSNKKIQMTCLSSSPGPLVLRLDNLLTEEECLHIINLASKRDMEKSFIMGEKPKSHTTSTKTDNINTVINNDKVENDKSMNEPYRDSAQAWIPYRQDDTLQSIQTRIASILKLPTTALQRAAEELQVVKYEKGGVFKVHHDSSAFHPRLLTSLIYLNTPDSGNDNNGNDNNGNDNNGGSGGSGSTWFPYAVTDSNNDGYEREYPVSVDEAIQQCSTSSNGNGNNNDIGLYVKPTAGSAVIFFNHRLTDGVIDPVAVHSGEKLHHGQKYIANLWVGMNIFDKK